MAFNRDKNNIISVYDLETKQIHAQFDGAKLDLEEECECIYI